MFSLNPEKPTYPQAQQTEKKDEEKSHMGLKEGSSSKVDSIRSGTLSLSKKGAFSRKKEVPKPSQTFSVFPPEPNLQNEPKENCPLEKMAIEVLTKLKQKKRPLPPSKHPLSLGRPPKRKLLPRPVLEILFPKEEKPFSKKNFERKNDWFEKVEELFPELYLGEEGRLCLTVEGHKKMVNQLFKEGQLDQAKAFLTFETAKEAEESWDAKLNEIIHASALLKIDFKTTLEMIKNLPGFEQSQHPFLSNGISEVQQIEFLVIRHSFVVMSSLVKKYEEAVKKFSLKEPPNTFISKDSPLCEGWNQENWMRTIDRFVAESQGLKINSQRLLNQVKQLAEFKECRDSRLSPMNSDAKNCEFLAYKGRLFLIKANAEILKKCIFHLKQIEIFQMGLLKNHSSILNTIKNLFDLDSHIQKFIIEMIEKRLDMKETFKKVEESSHAFFCGKDSSQSPLLDESVKKFLYVRFCCLYYNLRYESYAQLDRDNCVMF